MGIMAVAVCHYITGNPAAANPLGRYDARPDDCKGANLGAIYRLADRCVG